MPEKHPLPNHSIKGRCSRMRIAEDASIRPTPVVRQDQKDVRRPSPLANSGDQAMPQTRSTSSQSSPIAHSFQPPLLSLTSAPATTMSRDSLLDHPIIAFHPQRFESTIHSISDPRFHAPPFQPLPLRWSSPSSQQIFFLSRSSMTAMTHFY